jgi:phytoene dehydrogenase-like protein
MADVTYDVVILGSSPNELVCAAYLAKGGHKVLVLEPGPALGGAAARVEIAPGFRCAIAPAEAGWLPKKVVSELDLVAHGLDTQPTDPSLVALGADGPPIVLGTDLGKTRASISEHSKADAEKWEAFATQMDRLAGFLETLYVKEAIELINPAAGDMIELAAHGLRLRRLGKVDMVELLRVLPMSLQDLLDDWFEADVLKGAIAATGLCNLFQGPKSQGTGFSLLHHLAGRELGAFGARAFPKSERGGLVAALVAACGKLGVETRTGVDARVRVEGGRATGVTLPDGKTIAARCVASGADPRRALTGQLDAWQLPPEVIRAATTVKLRGIRSFLILAVDKLPTFRGLAPELLKAPVYLAPSLNALERAFDAAKHGGLPEAPTLEVTVPSLHDASLAPDGKHVVHVAIQHTPYKLRPGTWDGQARGALMATVRAALERQAPGLEASIAGGLLVTPADLERDHRITEGNLYGGELTLDQILFMRPIPGWAHYESPLPGYFFCGDATHPGGAIPGMAGHHAAGRIGRAARR